VGASIGLSVIQEKKPMAVYNDFTLVIPVKANYTAGDRCKECPHKFQCGTGSTLQLLAIETSVITSDKNTTKYDYRRYSALFRIPRFDCVDGMEPETLKFNVKEDDAIVRMPIDYIETISNIETHLSTIIIKGDWRILAE
jgi:hypothetical protein